MKKWYFILAIVLLVTLASCKANNTDGYNYSHATEHSNGTVESKSTEPYDHAEPPESIQVRSLEQLDEMRMMLRQTDEELDAYLLNATGGCADSKEDLVSFLDLIDSLPVLEVIEGDIIWIAHFYDQDRSTGKKQDGVVYISTMGSNGDWTRIEYLLSVKDVSGELEKLRADGEFDKSVISDVLQSNNGRVKVFSEIKKRHPNGNGDLIEWMITIDNTLARVVYYTSDSSDIQTSSVFGDISLTQISMKETTDNDN